MEGRSRISGVAIIYCLLLLVFAGLLGFIAGRVTVKQPEPKPEVIVKWKTIKVDSPIPSAQRTLPNRYFFIPVTDTQTQIIHDTTYIRVPVEQKEYGDSLYHAWVSGYHPQLDSIHLHIPTTYINVPVEKKVRPRWSVGITGGYGLSAQGLSPYVGIGLSYNLFSFGER